MKIDNEKQRKLLLYLIAVVPISGDYKPVKETINLISELEKSIANAEIEAE